MRGSNNSVTCLLEQRTKCLRETDTWCFMFQTVMRVLLLDVLVWYNNITRIIRVSYFDVVSFFCLPKQNVSEM